MTGSTSTPLRAGLLSLAALNLAIGAYGALAPHGFYRHVIGVDRLGPYNAHLLTDVGGFYLGFAVVFAWAGWTLSRELARGVCAGYGLTQLLHVAFHATHLGGFGAGEAIVQTSGLLVILAAPAACFRLASTGPP